MRFVPVLLLSLSACALEVGDSAELTAVGRRLLDMDLVLMLLAALGLFFYDKQSSVLWK